MSKAKKIIICFLGVCLIACSCLISSAYVTHHMNFARPEITEKSGYLEVVFSNHGAGVIYFTVVDRGQTTPDSCYFKATIEDGWLYIDNYRGNYINIDGNSVPIVKSGTHIYASGMTNGLELTSDYRLRRWLGNTGDITYIQGYNCEVTNTANYDINFTYGTDAESINKLEEIKQAINAQSSSSSNNAQSIQNNADKNASEIQSNNDKNTQSIIDNQNQLAEQEKTETQNSGDNSVNDVSGSVPDKSAGMLSALQSLSNAVSYTGTNATWKFPQMYIPAITGVTDRINLNPEMEINFTYWVNQIPQDIRTLISALATIGLVVFAFKELYSLISYVLTLKGGGNSE